MPRLRILNRSEVPDPIFFVADLARQGACAYLRISEPALHFIREHPMGELKHDTNVDGLTLVTQRTIFIADHLGLDGTIEVVCHEVKHIFDLEKFGSSTEDSAERFAEESWPSFRRGQPYPDILATLAEMNISAAIEIDNLQLALYSLRVLKAAGSSAAASFEKEIHAMQDRRFAAEHELLEIRRRIYAKIREDARVAMHARPKSSFLYL
jgi:hypothetical protein